MFVGRLFTWFWVDFGLPRIISRVAHTSRAARPDTELVGHSAHFFCVSYSL